MWTLQRISDKRHYIKKENNTQTNHLKLVTIGKKGLEYLLIINLSIFIQHGWQSKAHTFVCIINRNREIGPQLIFLMGLWRVVSESGGENLVNKEYALNVWIRQTSLMWYVSLCFHNNVSIIYLIFISFSRPFLLSNPIKAIVLLCMTS